jgi:exosortase/archaeosortase family protein
MITPNLFQGFESGLNETQQRLWRVFVFLVRMIVLTVPLYFILSASGILLPVQYAAADSTFWLLESAGYPMAQYGTSLVIEGQQHFAFFITEDCTGWKSMLFFFALVFAVTGIRMKKRLLGLAIGVPLIWLGNLARIFIIVWIQQGYGTGLAMLLHDIFWQAGLIALVLILWSVWFFKFSRTATDAGNNINQQN